MTLETGSTLEANNHEADYQSVEEFGTGLEVGSNLSVETGVTFVTLDGGHWHKHSITMDSDAILARITDAAVERFEALTLMQETLLLRAVEEISLCRFRESNKDTTYTVAEYEAWKLVVTTLLGKVGIDGLGI